MESSVRRQWSGIVVKKACSTLVMIRFVERYLEGFLLPVTFGPLVVVRLKLT